MLPEDAVTVPAARPTGGRRRRPAAVAADDLLCRGRRTKPTRTRRRESAGSRASSTSCRRSSSPPWSLDWHYRSRDEALIAFSNHHIYGDRLVTFPGPGGSPALRTSWCRTFPGLGRKRASPPKCGEWSSWCSSTPDHGRRDPRRHRDGHRARAAASRWRSIARDRTTPELDEFFATDRQERFFVKNLERVQGDERDAIILSVGYGKNEAGKLLYRFGPLLRRAASAG